MMAIAEATSPQGTVLGAVFTFLLYGALPLSIVMYLLRTPHRRRMRRAREEEEARAGEQEPQAEAAAPAEGKQQP